MTIRITASCAWCSNESPVQHQVPGEIILLPSGWNRRTVPSFREDAEGTGFYLDPSPRDLCPVCDKAANEIALKATQSANEASEQASRNTWREAVFGIMFPDGVA